jgi:uncharacterized membrane protein
MEKEPLLFGKLGWSLLAISLALILATTYFLPDMLNSFQLKMPEKWAPLTRLIVQITLGSWVAASAMSIIRAIIWLRCKLVLTNLKQYESERNAVTLVRDFTLWMLGIMTALAGYVTIWFSGG